MTLAMKFGKIAMDKPLHTELEMRKISAKKIPFSTCNIIRQQSLSGVVPKTFFFELYKSLYL